MDTLEKLTVATLLLGRLSDGHGAPILPLKGKDIILSVSVKEMMISLKLHPSEEIF